jgi:hypothetical protein
MPQASASFNLFTSRQQQAQVANPLIRYGLLA